MASEKNTASILIVDDDEALLQALPQVVHLRMPQVQVETSDRAADALGYVQEREYDAIVSDIKMPAMDGLELLAHLREVRPDTPVLLITGHSDHDLAIKALRGGAYDYIVKPIDRDTFVAAVQRAIQTYRLRRTVTEQQLALALHAKNLERLVEKRTSELVAANAVKDKFIDIVAHELKVPLSNLKSMTQLVYRQVEHGESATTVLQGLAELRRSIERTGILADDLLDVALMDTNMFVLQREHCNLVEFCRTMLNEYTGGSAHSLVCEFMGEPVVVEIDRGRISQVLINLLSNARKYSSPGSPITISVQQSGYEAVLSVRDQGIGIAEEELPHIFEQFYRVPGVEVQNGARAGLGLGLYISRKIVERHGGNIEVQSIPDQGSIFSIILPLYVDSASENPQDVEPVTGTQAVWTMLHR